MLVGRSVWILTSYDGIQLCTGPLRVVSLKQVLPQGEFVVPPVHEGGTPTTTTRKRTLVQFFADPGGMRTVAAAEVWSKDPGRASEPW